MTGPQSTILVIVVVAGVFFAWGRWRADLVAVAALCLSMIFDVLDPAQAFQGFADPSLIAIAAMMALGVAVREAGLFDALVGLIERLPQRLGLRGALTGGGIAVASALITSTEANEAFTPAVQATARQTGRPGTPMLAAIMLVASIGSTMVLAGSVPALLMSSIRQRALGSAFTVQALLPIGAIATLASLVVAALYWRQLKALPTEVLDPARRQRTLLFTSEVAIPAGSSLAGQSLRDIERTFKARIAVEAIIREDLRRLPARPDWVVLPGDILVVTGELNYLRRLVERFGLAPAIRTQAERAPELSGVVEAVVTPASPLIGQSQSSSALETRFGLSLLAVGRHGHEGSIRLRRLNLRAGDVLVFQGASSRLRTVVAELGCLVLDERRLRPGGQQILASVSILLGALVLAAFGKLPLAVALLCGLVLLVLVNGIGLAELYGTVRWPTLVQAGALIPLGAALANSGAAETLVHLAAFGRVPPVGLLVPMFLSLSIVGAAVIRVVPSAIFLAPFALSVAQKGGFEADPLLAAIVLGCACDLRSPVGLLGKGAASAGSGFGYARLAVAMASVVVIVGSIAILALRPVHS